MKPTITIEYCPKCHWLLRAAYMAQEILTTFADDVGAVTLKPSEINGSYTIFVADKKIMDSLSHNPVLGHINTFGGHPVCCAAGLAAFNALLQEKMIDSVKEKEQLFLSLLHHPKIKAVRSCGLMMAVDAMVRANSTDKAKVRDNSEMRCNGRNSGLGRR